MPHQDKNLVPHGHTTELTDDIESTVAFEFILNLLKSSATVTPPPDFTPKVIQCLSQLNIDPRRSSDRNSLNDRLQDAIGNLTSPATAMEMATCFFLSGFFYLVLGISLHLGLKSLGVNPQATGWIYYQPHLAVLIAMGFSTVGFLFLKNSHRAFRIANLTTIVYILFSIFNSVQVQLISSNPFSISAVLCFSAGTIFVGVFLAVTVNNFKRWASPSRIGSP